MINAPPAAQPGSSPYPRGTPPGTPRAGPWPARLDLLQSASGLFLGLFMWLHMGFVSSILISPDAFWTVARFFEGYFIFGRAFPWLVSLFVAAVFGIIVIHAGLALRKFPGQWQQYAVFWRHMGRMGHGDTTLWFLQVVTGFAMFFLAPVHLYLMLTQPELIGPYESADRVWSGNMWPLYLILLFMVEIHAGVGLYRLAVKWHGFRDPVLARHRLMVLKWGFTVFFLVLGLFSLAAYVKLGMDHADRAGERYRPVSGFLPPLQGGGAWVMTGIDVAGKVGIPPSPPFTKGGVVPGVESGVVS